jgi:hypothetical protein
VAKQSPAIQLLVHILGEMMVQQARLQGNKEQQGRLTPGGGQTQPSQPSQQTPPPQMNNNASGQGNMGNEMRQVMPNRVQGGADVARGF